MKTIYNYGTVVSGELTRSGQPDAKGFKKLKTKGVTVILKLTTNQEYSNKLEREQFGGKVKIGYVTADTKSDPYYCEEGIKWADWIDKQIKKGEWVHVHCRLGRDRTGLVIGEWMIRHGGYKYKDVEKTWKKYGAPFLSFQECLRNASAVN